MILEQHSSYKVSESFWLGEIPAHWQTIKMKYATSIINGFAFKADEYLEDGIPIIRIGDVKSPINLDECKRVPEEYLDKAKDFKIFKGDILIALTGATIGKSAVYDIEDIALLNQRVAIIRPTDKLNNDFLKFIVLSNEFREYILLECDGGAQENIGKEEIGSYRIPLPPIEEQNAIAEFLNSKFTEIEIIVKNLQELSGKETKDKGLLGNYFQQLISLAITGKIKLV